MGFGPLDAPGHAWVDVRDVAETHVRALERPEAGGREEDRGRQAGR